MDTTDPDIRFDENGVCNHCHFYAELIQKLPYKDSKEKEEQFNLLIDEIKRSTKGDGYDCVIGLSGGVDSSYLAYIVKKAGLKPLAIHVDNGWDSELAVKNIENIVKRLNINLYTHVILWEEFRELQLAFLKASVIDLEMLSDNAIVAGIYKVAANKKIKNFIIGTNFMTESIMPCSWFYADKCDGLQIKSIYKRFGSGKKLKTYPIFNFYEYTRYRQSRDLRFIPLLEYMNYNKNCAMDTLKKEFGWRDYGGKHHESIITKFYQSYILPRKFNVDKRRAHLSNLICSGQITRDEALTIIKKEPCEPDKLKEDKEYFLKKLNLTEAEFEKYIKQPIVSHYDYPSYGVWHSRLNRLKNICRR